MPSSSHSLAGALGHDLSDRRIGILRQIGALGSISRAARAVGVSYKAAWQAVDTLTNLAGVALVERVVGGAGGGGARLTPAGLELLAAADAMAQARSAVLQRLKQPAPRLGVKTSMRNQWPCVVESVQRLGPIARVHLQAAEPGAVALSLASRITAESAELLGLQPGLAVQALCKATAVRVERGAKSAPAAAPDQPGSFRLPARAVRVVRGPSGDEVSAQLAAGVQMVGFAAPGSGLRAGSPVTLVLDENVVVLALAEV